MMDKKSKIFVTVFIIVIAISVVITYYKYIALEEFEVFTDEEIFNESLLDY